PAPKGRDSVFHRLGPQVGNLVVDRSEANLHADCVPSPKQVEAGPVSHNEADGTSTGGWEIVQRRKVQRKPSTPRPSTESPHTELRSAQGASHRPQGDCLLPPPTPVPSITSAPASVLAGSRGNKGKSVSPLPGTKNILARDVFVASCGFGDLKGLASFWLPAVPELWVFCDSSFLLRDRGFIAQQCPWGAAASLSGWFLFLLHGIHLHALACGCDFLEIHLLAVVDFGSFSLAMLWTTVSCAWLQLFRLGWACTILLLLL
ncbi:hypothetical protein H0E87_025247, partial [Populus deltoides]